MGMRASSDALAGGDEQAAQGEETENRRDEHDVEH
jgi:hypothetical protein